MSSTDALNEPAPSEDHIEAEPSEFWKTLESVLAPLASLKLTVFLFLLSIFIVLAGTLAQVEADIWEVIGEYFRVNFNNVLVDSAPYINFGEFFVRIKAELFFPPSFFPEAQVFPKGLGWLQPIWPTGTPSFLKGQGIWFPKGWLIGFFMMLNLFAAHLIRFKVQAKGNRLGVGSVVLAFGILLTGFVIWSGSNPDGLQANPFIGYETLRLLLITGTFGLCGVTLLGTFITDKLEHRWLYGMSSVLLAGTALFIAWWNASDEASMRILYQLVKATIAACVMLIGCIMLFKKRAGIVLLHGGIGLIMLYDVLVGVGHIESRMTLTEGEATNYSSDIRSAEFAIIDPSDEEVDKVTVIDGNQIREGATIDDERIPFKIEVVKYYPNSMPRMMASFGPNEEKPENPATTGFGLRAVALPVDTAKGTDTNSQIDVPSAYVKLTSKDGEDLGTYLTSAFFGMAGDLFPETESVEVGDTTYQFGLRFERHYDDYTITLNDVQKNDYKGTSRVKDYSSYITVRDPERDTEFEQRIWMNNPMRYAGKTFYQSGYQQLSGGLESSTLQVVDNEGWMTPYVACMIVAVGMLYQFSMTLLVYLRRRLSERKQKKIESGKSFTFLDWTGVGLSALIAFSILGSVYSLGRAPSGKIGEFHLAEFGELPIWYMGRPMPIDSFAEHELLNLSDRKSWKAEVTNEEGETELKSRPAVEWLMEMMANQDKARDLRTIRIENTDVLEAIGLEEREGFTYAPNELQENFNVIVEQASAASDVKAEDRTVFQRKFIELANRMRSYLFIEFAVGTAPKLPAEEKLDDPLAERNRLIQRVDRYMQLVRFFDRESEERFGSKPLPLMVPSHLGVDEENRPPIKAFEADWVPVFKAGVFEQFYAEFPQETPPAIELFSQMLDAYAGGDTATFNSHLEKYRKLLEKHAGEKDAQLPLAKTDFEAKYNRYGALNVSSWLYIVGFVFAVLGWLFLPEVFQRTAFWTIAAIFLIHTAALGARLYISGRPPVTNLYSSAVFIGWAVVLGGLIVESINKMGFGNVVAAAAGFLTLRIAANLAMTEDTFVVLEAVLDTQFWLATHVVCITLGYATTYMAGLFGAAYIGDGVFTPGLTKNVSKEVTRMTYGVLCFATFFSFVGTVLGGLWADDSWGRFWGWDPKENGALIIVLWNALVLHAYWGRMVRERGLAVLCVLGNIVVSWSWFGVNELSVGLHSYGFTEGRLIWLVIFGFSQLVLAGVGCLPKALWMSNRSEPVETAET